MWRHFAYLGLVSWFLNWRIPNLEFEEKTSPKKRDTPIGVEWGKFKSSSRSKTIAALYNTYVFSHLLDYCQISILFNSIFINLPQDHNLYKHNWTPLEQKPLLRVSIYKTQSNTRQGDRYRFYWQYKPPWILPCMPMTRNG